MISGAEFCLTCHECLCRSYVTFYEGCISSPDSSFEIFTVCETAVARRVIFKCFVSCNLECSLFLNRFHFRLACTFFLWVPCLDVSSNGHWPGQIFSFRRSLCIIFNVFFQVFHRSSSPLFPVYLVRLPWSWELPSSSVILEQCWPIAWWLDQTMKTRQKTVIRPCKEAK